MWEADVRLNMQVKRIAKFLENVLPNTTSKKNVSYEIESLNIETQAPSVPQRAQNSNCPTSSTYFKREVVYEAPRRHSVEIEVDDDDDGDTAIEEDMKKFGRKYFGDIPGPYLTSYVSVGHTLINNTAFEETRMALLR
jgi:hypothetical protein